MAAFAAQQNFDSQWISASGKDAFNPPPVMLRLLRQRWPEARARFTLSETRPDST